MLHVHSALAAITVAVLPAVKKDGMREKALELDKLLRLAASQRATTRAPCANVVTVRRRDSVNQESVKTRDLSAHLTKSNARWKRAR